MNMLFGFQAEATLKYDDQVFHLFSDAFRAMPVATPPALCQRKSRTTIRLSDMRARASAHEHILY